MGRDAIVKLGNDITSLINSKAVTVSSSVLAVFDSLQPDEKLQAECQKLCSKFPDLFKPEPGCLKNFELKVEFKENATPIFCKPRLVPFAIREDLTQSYDAGIRRGVWEPTSFNSYGTPVVPIRKTPLPGQQKGKLRVCGDYSVTVYPQLQEHRQPIPLPEDLM